MRTDEAAGRANVVREIRRWIGTPYHHASDVLGAGVDCGMSLVRAFVDAGVIPAFDPRPYPADWMLHQDEERYLDLVRRFAGREFNPADEPPRAGDVVVWRHGRTFSHGGVVTGAPGSLSGWPFVTHAYARAGLVEEVDVTRDRALMRLADGPRPMRAFSYWG